VSVQSQVQQPTPTTPNATGFIKPPPTGPALAAQSAQFHASMRGQHGFGMAVPGRGRGAKQRGMGRGYAMAIKTSMAPVSQQIQIQQAYEMVAQQEMLQQDPNAATMETVAPEEQQVQQ